MSSASAQAATNSIRTHVIYNETLRAGTPTFVVLREGTAYRIEIIPEDPFDAFNSPTVSVRPHQRPELPIRVFSDGETSSRGGQSFIIVPSASAEYRLDMYSTSETATIRIEQAGDELQRLFDAAARPGRSVLTFGAQAVAMGTFEVVKSDLASDTVFGGRASGVEGCIGIAPGRLGPGRRLAGCLLTFGFLSHGSGASLTMFGTAPQFRLISRGRNSIALATNLAVGKADQPFRNARYLVAGVGLSVSRTVGPLTLQVVPGLSMVRRGSYQLPGGPAVEAVSTTTHRVSFGIQF